MERLRGSSNLFLREQGELPWALANQSRYNLHHHHNHHQYYYYYYYHHISTILSCNDDEPKLRSRCVLEVWRPEDSLTSI